MQILRAIDVDQITQHTTGHCSDTGLQQNVRRGYAHFTHLLDGFICQGCVALHDPGWDFGVTFPCRVLYHFPAVLLRVLHGQANGIVIVHIRDDALGTEVQNGVNAFLSRTFRHVNHRILSELLCCPRHTAPVVAVGGGRESHFFADGIFQVLK